MKVLYVSSQNPYGVGGGCYASHAYLKAFSQIAEGNIDLVIAKEWQGVEDKTIKIKNTYKVPRRKTLSRALSLLTGDLHRYTKFVTKLLRNVNNEKYDYVVFSGFFGGSTLAITAKKFGAIPVTIHHNFEAEYFRDNLKGGISSKLLIWQVKRAERRAYLNSDINMFLTQQDMDKFVEEYGEGKNNNHLISTFDYSEGEELTGTSVHTGPLTFVITGSLCVKQGVDGVMFFFEELYDKLPKESRVIIAGQSPTSDIVNECSKHANVDLKASPVSMEAILKEGDVYICPTYLGGGMKLRVMDGLKHGMPVITHSRSARGYDLFYNTPQFKIFSNATEFEEKLQELLKDLECGLVNHETVKRLYNQNFSLSAGRMRILNALNT